MSVSYSLSQQDIGNPASIISAYPPEGGLITH